MARELTCITCPLGCRLSVETDPSGELLVSGNRCPRGAVYAKEEFFSPKRTVTATCPAACAGTKAACPDGADPALPHARIRRVPIRSTAPFPKERIEELLRIVYATEVPLPVARGEVVLRDALGTGIDLIATRSVPA